MAVTSQAKQRAVALRAHGLRAPPDDQADLARNGTTTATMTAAPAGATQDETIHTTANHPWLTTDRCWVLAGDLHTGEPVRTLDGQTALVAWVHTVSGQADYYNLTVADDHTYAVGDGQYVVHNSNACGLWTKTQFKGNDVYQRDDLIDPNATDARGRTNLARMGKGLAPIGPDGEPLQLHHMIQTQDGGIAEVTGTFHRDNFSTLHINPNTTPSGINRGAFGTWKRAYWKWRADDFQP